MTVFGPSRHFPATQQFGRFRSEADIERVGDGKVMLTLKTKNGIAQFTTTATMLVQLVNVATSMMNANLSGFLTDIGMI